MHTILGAGGSIGFEVAKALVSYQKEIRLVSRNPKKVNETDQLLKADLTNTAEIDAAVQGSEVVYLLVGLVYDTKIWQKQWPKLMDDVLTACQKHGSKLVFFDNIYMIDKAALGQITEDSPINPCSKKGEVRALVDQKVLDAMGKNGFQALIARAADFYGPYIEKSVLMQMVYKNLKDGKAGQWFSRLDKKHSFTYTPDAGKAVALLGNSPEAFNQVWNLPTDKTLYTGREWISILAKEMGKKDKAQVLPVWLLKVLGLFIPIMKEFPEMAYQYENDYFFDSSKIERQFGLKPTPYLQGIKETLTQLGS